MKTPVPVIPAKQAPAEWQAAASAPHGVPLSVRETPTSDSVTAIRDPYVGWWDENRRDVLAFTPTEWQPLV